MSAAPPVVRWLAPLAVAAVGLLAYATSLANGFIWDDPIILKRQLAVFRSLGDVLVPPRDIPQFSPDYYRPVTIATYLLDRAVGGDAPFCFHLSVVLWHVGTAVLVYALALQLLGRAPAGRLGATGAGLLFALHPIHTESVAWAAGRADVVATGLMVAALVVHGRGASWRASAATGLLAAGALGAKEIGVALYPLLVLRDLFAAGGVRRRRADWARAYAGPALALAVYVLLRRRALGEFVGSAPQELPVEPSALDVAAVVGMYVEKLLWPIGLNAYIDHVPIGPLPLALAGIAVLACAAAARRWWRTGDGVPLFALLWTALTLVPSLAIVWKIPDAPVAERYLYLPSVGFCLLCGDGLARWLRAVPARTMRVLGLGLVAVLLGAAGVATARRNRVWRDDVSLWEDTAGKSRVSGMAARSLGTAYLQAGRPADARAAFEVALQRRNTARGLQIIHNNLGTLAMYEQDYAAAQDHYTVALRANPDEPDTLFNLGLAILQAGGRSREAAAPALDYYHRAQALNPHDPDIEAALGQAYAILDDRERAAVHLRRALDLGPSPAAARRIEALLREVTGSAGDTR